MLTRAFPRPLAVIQKLGLVMDPYLSKPVRAEDLLRQIQDCVPGSHSSNRPISAVGKRSGPFSEAEYLARMGETRNSCAPIVEAFLVECPELMTGLRNALQRKDAPELARLANALKGAISNFIQDTAFQS